MTGPTSFDDRYSEPDQLRDQLRRLLRYRKTIALGIALGLLCGVLLALFRSDRYTSTGEVVVRSAADPFSFNVSIDQQVSMATERQVALSTTVATRAAKVLSGPVGAAALRRDLRVSNPPDTQVLRFEYTAGTPDRAARVTHAFVRAYLADREDRTEARVERMTTALDEQLDTLGKQSKSTSGAARTGVQTQITTLQKRLADLKIRDTTGGDIVFEGGPPAQPTGPRKAVVIGLALLGGLILGIIVAWLRCVLEPRVRSVSDMQSSLGAPVLGILPGAVEDDELLAVGRSRSRLTEAYRTLAFRLTHDQRSAGRSSLLVLAPREHRNAEAVAVNICAAIAEIGHDVVLVDATATTPAPASRLPLLPDCDVSDVSDSDLAAVVVDAGKAGRFTLLSGNGGTDAAGSPAALGATCLLPATDPATSVVVLTRALLDQADGLALAQRVDGVLVVGGLNLTRRDDLRRVRELIACAGGRVVGSVLDTGARGGRLSDALDGARHRRKKYRARVTPVLPDAGPQVRPVADRSGEGPRAETIPQPDAGSSDAQDETLTASKG
ncbi:hypothetical protein NLX86_17020 [Streptomyces sp. A3M-1-3]|uniref:hypothetical protein n=1 Tax=Streptomyces sp. A3M-1-3 TaxID=2962044 RepID=UPI0020B79E43|nr:hypothetical protein [Streptomyces sp. A3M-1-3]MCP3819738.1 hypothetical protein [Streptomyces sp. A3M-1-3]